MGRPRLFDLEGAVSSALNVFWERGYGATTPAELLDAIGVGKGSFYNAFGSKHALFEQALRRYGDERVAGLSSRLAGSGPVGQRIKGYLERLIAPENEKALRRGCFSDVAKAALLPVAAILVGLAFAWAGSAIALLQTSQLQRVGQREDGLALRRVVFGFQTAILVILSAIVLWSLLAAGLGDNWSAARIEWLRWVGRTAMFALSSITVRECWQVTLAVQRQIVQHMQVARAEAESRRAAQERQQHTVEGLGTGVRVGIDDETPESADVTPLEPAAKRQS